MTRAYAFAVILAFATLSACDPARSVAPAPWSDVALVDLSALAGSAYFEGLPDERASIAELERLRHSAVTESDREMLYAAADQLFLRLADAYARGAVDPAVDASWRLARAAAPDLEMLRAARAGGALPTSLVSPLLPDDAAYAALRDELERVISEPPDSADTDGRSHTARLDSLRATMERRRWLPRDLPTHRVEVRTPHFEVALLNEDEETTYAAIVGAARTPTPSFEARIEAVTLNPTWTPPNSIVQNELLPLFRRNPDAASAYDVLDRDGRVVDGNTIDWSRRPFPYTLRQRAGAANALGQLKFEMPNTHDVYLHDTPNRSLFERTNRALSHGCVRVRYPVELASRLLGRESASLQSEIDAGTTQRLPLPAPRPVYVLYVTAVAGMDGTVRYADDLYSRDTAIIAALDSPDAELVARRASPEQGQVGCPL